MHGPVRCIHVVLCVTKEGGLGEENDSEEKDKVRLWKVNLLLCGASVNSSNF